MRKLKKRTILQRKPTADKREVRARTTSFTRAPSLKFSRISVLTLQQS